MTYDMIELRGCSFVPFQHGVNYIIITLCFLLFCFKVFVEILGMYDIVICWLMLMFTVRRTNHFDKENIELRQQGIDGTYRRLQKIALSRKRYLEDAIKLFSFYRECDEFQVWMKEKVSRFTIS